MHITILQLGLIVGLSMAQGVLIKDWLADKALLRAIDREDEKEAVLTKKAA